MKYTLEEHEKHLKRIKGYDSLEEETEMYADLLEEMKRWSKIEEHLNYCQSCCGVEYMEKNPDGR